MFTLENEYFVRLFVLILKGGTLVLRQVLVKKLADRGSQLDDFIKANKEEIKKLKEGKVFTLKQYNMLFPNGGQTIDICKWDISLLSCLLLNIFDLSVQKEQNAIENLRKIRNEIVAHHPDGTIKTKIFFNKWNNLNTAIMNLANGLSETERSELVEVTRAAGEDPLDIKDTIQNFKDMGELDQDLEDISQTLEQLSHNVQELRTNQKDMHADISYIKDELLLKQRLQKDNQDISTVIIGEIKISGNDAIAVTNAAAILIADANKSKENGSEQGAINTVFSVFTRVKIVCCKSDIPTDGTESVTTLFQDIRNAGGEVLEATQGSVLLHIQCHSVTGVLNVLDYFQSVKIKHRLDKIAAYLHEQIGFPVSLEACIQVQSLWGALHLIQEKQKQEFTKSVHFVMKCRNAESVSNITNIFDGQDALANMSALSEGLSNKVGSQVTLKAFMKTDISQAGKHAFGAWDLEQEPTGQCVRGLESHKEQERNGSQSNELTGEQPWTSVEQSDDNAISLLRLGEHQYEFVACLVCSDKDKLVSDLVKDELGRALHNLTDIDRDLICTARKYNPPGSYILYEFMQCLKRSSTVIMIESECLGESHYAMLKDAHNFGKQIISITFEKDEPYLKVFTNDLRLVLKKENEKYTLNKSWREVAISIIKLIASEVGVNAQEIYSRTSRTRLSSGIKKIADAIPVSSNSDETPPLKENTKLETGDCPVPLNADIFKEMLPSLKKRRSKEDNEEEDNAFLDPMTEQEITGEKKLLKASDCAYKSWGDCDRRIIFNTSASQGYEQARRQEYGIASRAYSCPELGFYGGPFKLDNVYNYSKLKVSNFDLPKDVDRDELEKYLTKDEFEDIFKMTIEEFRELPELKRNDLKRKADLY